MTDVLPNRANVEKTKEDLRAVPILLVVSIVLAGRLFKLISHYAVNIFLSDQWDFNSATLFERHTLWEMFRWQHGPHRQGLGALLAWLVEPLFSWNSRTESFVVGGIIVIAAGCALFLKKKLYGSLSLVDVVIPVVFFTPLQYESLFFATNFAHGPLPLLLVILYCLAWTCTDLTTRYRLVLVINFVTIYTGFGLFIGFLTPLLLTADYRASLRNSSSRRHYFVAMVLATGSLASFFLNYTFASAMECFSARPQKPLEYVWFVDFMLANFFGVTRIGSLGKAIGTALLVIMLAALIGSALKLLNASTSAAEWTQNLVVATLVAYCLLFCINTAYGRVCGGLSFALTSRYVNYVELGILGLYFYLLTVRGRWARRILTAVLVAGLSVGSMPIASRDRYLIRTISDYRRNWRDCYLRTSDIELCDQEAGHWIYPPAGLGRNRLKEKLDYLKRTKQNLYSDMK